MTYSMSDTPSGVTVILQGELQYLAELEIDFDVTVTGFDLPEIDILIGDLSLGLNDSDSADAAVGFGQSGEQLVRKSR